MDAKPSSSPPTPPDSGEASGTGRVSLVDVARHAGVSRATASLVLRDSPLVASDTRARVSAAIEQLGYIYNRGAANLRALRTKTVGLLVSDFVNPFFAEMTVGADDVLDNAGYVAFMANTAESTERQLRFLQRMREQNVDGILLCPVAGTPADLIQRLRTWDLACVQVLRHVSLHDTDYAGPDYEFGLQQATEHLIRLGHRRIAFLGGERVYSAVTERRAGFIAAMQRHDLPIDLIIGSPLTRRAGADAVCALLDRDDPPTAAICFNDVLAFGVLRGLESRGLRAGRDFAVVGVDDVPEAGLSQPALTTVSTSPRQVGAEAARLLLNRIADPRRPFERVILPCRLVVRESCGAAK